MTNVFHSGNATQYVPPTETDEERAAREAVEARIKVGKPSPEPKEIVFDDEGIYEGVAHDLAAEAREAERVAAEAAAAKATTTTTKASTSATSSSSSSSS